LALVLHGALKRLHEQIHGEILFYQNILMIGKDKAVDCETKVKHWQDCHLRMLLFCGSINQFFSLILFAAYGLDFLTILAFAARIVQNPNANADPYIYLIFGILLFLSYGMLFLIPLIVVYEKVCVPSFSSSKESIEHFQFLFSEL
jgi:hypothetical protein